MWYIRSYSIYLNGFLLTLFSSRTVQFSMFFHISKLIQTFQTDWLEYSTQSSQIIYNYCSTDYPLSCHPSCTRVIYHILSLNMIYFILLFKSFYPTLLVAMSDIWRNPLHHSIWCIFHFSPFLKKCTLLEMCLVCLVSLPFLAIHTEELLSNIIRGDASGTLSGSLFKYSRIKPWNVLKPFL